MERMVASSAPAPVQVEAADRHRGHHALATHAMTLHDLDGRLYDFLGLAAVAAIDRSRNGLQVARHDEEVRRVAFAVDASLETFQRAAAWGADVLVVHHGCSGRILSS